MSDIIDVFYTKKEVAKLLKVSEVTVNRLVADNAIEFIRAKGSIRISRTSLQNYIDSNTVKKKSNGGEI